MHFDSYYNGKYGKYGEIRVPLSDRALFFGDGVYDAVLGCEGKLFLLDEHIDRLYANADAISLPPPVTRQELLNIIFSLTKERHGCFFLYIQLSRSGATRQHGFSTPSESNLLVTVTEKPMPSVDHFLHLVAYEDKRHRMCNIKALNLLPSVLASAFALSEGADEAVFHRGDTVTECAHSNLHIIKDGTLFTHPLGELILPGIERAHLVTVCKRLGIDVKEVPFTLQELRCCDEVLVSSTTRICNLAHSFQDVIYQLKGDSMGAAIIAEMHRDFKSFCGIDPLR